VAFCKIVRKEIATEGRERHEAAEPEHGSLAF